MPTGAQCDPLTDEAGASLLHHAATHRGARHGVRSPSVLRARDHPTCASGRALIRPRRRGRAHPTVTSTTVNPDFVTEIPENRTFSSATPITSATRLSDRSVRQANSANDLEAEIDGAIERRVLLCDHSGRSRRSGSTVIGGVAARRHTTGRSRRCHDRDGVLTADAAGGSWVDERCRTPHGSCHA